MRCDNCDRPLATKQDAQAIPPGEGEHLCWGGCEPEDWRARALKAERERDEACSQMRELAEVTARNVNEARHLRQSAIELERERDEARAEVERLRGQLEWQVACTKALMENQEQRAAESRTVAERQREADRKAFSMWLREVHATGFPHETPEVLASAVDAGEVSLPLVTEGDK